MSKERAKDICTRAGKTFLQAFIGAISIDALMAAPDRSVWKSMLMGAIAAGISAVMNLAINLLDEKSE